MVVLNKSNIIAEQWLHVERQIEQEYVSGVNFALDDKYSPLIFEKNDQELGMNI